MYISLVRAWICWRMILLLWRNTKISLIDCSLKKQNQCENKSIPSWWFWPKLKRKIYGEKSVSRDNCSQTKFFTELSLLFTKWYHQKSINLTSFHNQSVLISFCVHRILSLKVIALLCVFLYNVVKLVAKSVPFEWIQQNKKKEEFLLYTMDWAYTDWLFEITI